MRKYFFRLSDPCSGSNHLLSHGDAIVGNIIDKVRRQRRHQTKNRPSTSLSLSCTISSDSSTGSDASTGRRFPIVLPQSVVELELGIVGIQNQPPSVPQNSSVSANGMPCVDEVTVRLLSAAREWRETSQRSRSTGVRNTKWFFCHLHHLNTKINRIKRKMCILNCLDILPMRNATNALKMNCAERLFHISPFAGY